MIVSNLITSVNRYLHLPASSSDVRDVLLEIYNATLNSMVPKRVDYLKAEISLTVPATLTVIPTRLTDYTLGLTANPATSDGIQYLLDCPDLDYTGKVILIQPDTPTTSQCTLTVDTPVGAFPATTSEMYAYGVNLVDLQAPQNIHGTVSYDLHPYSIYGVYADSVLIPSCNEYYMSTTPGTLNAYHYASPVLHFVNPVAAATDLVIKCFRMPKQVDISSYSGTEVVDWPTGWEQYLILQIVHTYALQERDTNLAASFTETLREMGRAFLAEQNTLSGNLYDYNLRPGLRGHRDRTK